MSVEKALGCEEKALGCEELAELLPRLKGVDCGCGCGCGCVNVGLALLAGCVSHCSTDASLGC
tara:strand:+ start:187 stop:375 length:189 start_codon:yes stop_codon:yes gene_type:complete